MSENLNESDEEPTSVAARILTQDFKNTLSLHRKYRRMKSCSKETGLIAFSVCQLDSSLMGLRQYLKRNLT
jgi:hypothetical protein